ncbi:hypothetical protein Tco_0439026 [Tanacetum coccineum]
MEAQSFRDLIIQNMDSIEQCIPARTLHDRKTTIRLNERKLQLQDCKVTVVQAFDANLVVTESSGTESAKQPKELVNSSVYKESSRTVSGTHNQIENKSSKSRISSSIFENDKKADGADIGPTCDTDSLEQVDNDDY